MRSRAIIQNALRLSALLALGGSLALPFACGGDGDAFTSSGGSGVSG